MTLEANGNARLHGAPTRVHERDLEEMDMDEYQSLASSTAVYPRVYTEQQVRAMFEEYESNFAVLEMTLDESINFVLDKHETPFNRMVYPVLGLLGEAGEIANKLKKVARDKGGDWGPDMTQDYEAELGDVQWYVAAIAKELQVKLGAVASKNIQKLFDRKQRGVLGGSGDKR